MAEDLDIPPSDEGQGRSFLIRILLWIGFGIVAIALLMAALVVVLDTSPGRRFIADRIENLAPGSGLRVSVGRIEGSIYGRMTIRDLRLSDPQGVFLESPRVTLDWRPAAWLANRLQINELTSPLVRFHRPPRLRPSGRTGSILPDFDIRIGQLRIDRLWFGSGFGAQPRTAVVIGEADIHDRRAMIRFATRLRDGGDRMALILDADPDRDRFKLDGAVFAPKGGIIAKLAGLGQTLDLRVAGRGSWTMWKGRMTGSAGDQSILDLSLTNSSGQFDLSGTAAPAQFLRGRMKALTSPRILITGTAKLEDRRVDMTAALRSAALQLDGNGIIDLGAGSFDGFSVNAVLLKPEALFTNMRGKDVRLKATIAGPFSGPTIEYAAASPQLYFDNTGFENARLAGCATLVGQRKTIPVTFTARRVLGAGEDAGRILANLRVEGPLFLEGSTLSSDRLLIRSDKVNGRLGLTIDLATGRYAVMLDGKLDRYLIPGIGIVDVRTNMRITPGQTRGSMLTGTAHAVVRRFDSGFFHNLAGGLPTLDTGIARGPDGIIHFPNLRLRAPSLQLNGEALRRADGTFLMKARGRQQTYGDMVLTVDGPLTRPRVNLLLPRPHLGANLSDVVLRLDPDATGWRFTTGGRSILGPFSGTGRLVLLPGQPMSIEVGRLAVVDAVASGTLRSLEGGLAGTLAITGGGLNGTVTLQPVGNVQRIDTQLSVRRARFPGPPEFFVGRGQLNATAILYPSGPSIQGNFSARRIRYGKTLLRQATGTASIANGSGSVSASLSGTANIPFSFNAKADFTPSSISISGSGTLENQPIRLTNPAVLNRDGDDWVLRQARIDFASGSADLSGRWGTRLELSAKLNNLGLGILDIINPRLGLSGRASGTLSYTQSSPKELPKARVALTVRGLSRSGLALTSTPFDLGVAMLLDGRAAAMRAVIQSKGQVVGRAQGRLAPIPGDVNDTLLERLYAAPLFAQLRYNGPLDALWRLTGIETIDLSGPAQIAADIGGRLGEPAIRGVVHTNGARLESRQIGAVITQINTDGRFNGSRLVIPKFTGATQRGGTLSGNATIDLSAVNGFGMDVQINADNARLINRDDLRANITGPLRLKSDSGGGMISGNVTIDTGRFRLGRPAAVEVPKLDVREINGADGEDEAAKPAKPWRLDISAKGRNQLMVTGMGLDSEWRTDMKIGGTTERMDILGQADLLRGTYEFAGKRFDLLRGQIRFTGGYPPDPTLDIVAEADVQGLSATIRVGGTALKPEIAFSSVPALPEDEVLSRLLFGTSVANLSAPEALQLAGAVATLRTGGSGAGNPLNRVGRALGIDRIRILPSDQATGQGTTVAAGKYIGKRVYVEVASDAQGYSATQIEVELTRWLSVLSKVSTLGETSLNVKVSKDY